LGNSKTLSQNKNLKQIKYKNETKTEMLWNLKLWTPLGYSKGFSFLSTADFRLRMLNLYLVCLAAIVILPLDSGLQRTAAYSLEAHIYAHNKNAFWMNMENGMCPKRKVTQEEIIVCFRLSFSFWEFCFVSKLYSKNV
jgi:hypothetical protein